MKTLLVKSLGRDGEVREGELERGREGENVTREWWSGIMADTMDGCDRRPLTADESLCLRE